LTKLVSSLETKKNKKEKKKRKRHRHRHSHGHDSGAFNEETLIFDAEEDEELLFGAP